MNALRRVASLSAAFLLFAGLASAQEACVATSGPEVAPGAEAAVDGAGCATGRAGTAGDARFVWSPGGAGPAWDLDVQTGYAPAQLVISALGQDGGQRTEVLRVETAEAGYHARPASGREGAPPGTPRTPTTLGLGSEGP